MNVWKSIFIAELRRERVFFGIFLLLKAAYIAIMVGVLRDRPWTDEIPAGFGYLSPSLPATASLFLVAYAVCRSAWLDNPTRGGSHLAFRPVKSRVVATALIAAWCLLFALPSSIAEGIVVHCYQFPLRTVILGSIQSGIVTTTVILTALWMTWLAGTRLRIAFAIVSFVAAYFHAMSALAFCRDLLPEVMKYVSPLIFHPLTILLGFLLLSAHSIRPMRGWIRVISVPAVAYVSLLLAGPAGSLFSPPTGFHPAPQSTETATTIDPPAIATASYSRHTNRPDPALLEVEPPAPPSLGIDQQVTWEATSLRANGSVMRDFRPDPRTITFRPIYFPNLASYNALSRHLGDKIMVDRSISTSRTIPAQAQLRKHNEAPELQELSCELTGTITCWAVTGDRRLKLSETSGRIMLNHRYYLWITPSDPYQMKDRNEIYYLYSPANGLLTELQTRDSTSSMGISVSWMGPDKYDARQRPYGGHRLITLRSDPVGMLKTSVTIPGTVPFRIQDGDGGPIPYGTKAVEAFQAWLAAHPAAAMDAPEPVIGAWLRDFLPRIPISERRPLAEVREIIRAVAENHPVLLLETLQQLGNNAGVAHMHVSDAIPESLLRDAIVRRPGAYTSAPRGPLQPGDEKLAQVLGPYAAMKARRGESLAVLEILFSVPEAVGLTRAEWLDVFRLHPSARSHNALLKIGVPEKELLEMTSAQLEVMFPVSYSEGNILETGVFPGDTKHTDGRDAFGRFSKGSVPDVELALASGHPRAVEWYVRCFQSMTRSGEIHLPSFSARGATIFRDATEPLRRYFMVPEDIPEKDTARQISWFLSHQPEDFAFDPEIRKFRLK